VAWRDGHLTDPGAGNGTFKTPTLREIARTAPYMHDGSFNTLKDVVDFYDRGGNGNPFIDPELRRLALTDSEKRAVIAFLQSLAGTVDK
jgi:cytochrome c peroxidase